MGEILYGDYLKWLQEYEGVKLHEFILEHGVSGLLHSFEEWLLKQGYLKYESGQYVKPK